MTNPLVRIHVATVVWNGEIGRLDHLSLGAPA
jgi:hypothetical protein